MKKITVTGKTPMFGEVFVSGSKNAALPILFASLAVKGRSVIKNLPDIGDVRVAIDILRSFGVKVVRGAGAVIVDSTNAEYKAPPEEQISKIRGSTYLIGACLSRFGICRLTPFGGCDFAPRPIDLHLFVAEMLGATVDEGCVRAQGLHGASIRLPKPSVGATVNALIICSSINEESEIYGYAKEMHVMNFIDFLRSAGADITVDGERIAVRGTSLSGGSVTLIPDMIEAGTYAIGAVATGGDVRVYGADPVELSALNTLLSDAGASVKAGDGFIRYSGTLKREVDVYASPYPGFPTDLQPPMAVALAACRGGRIRDAVFPDRFGYLAELSSFGIRSAVAFSCAHVYPSLPFCASEVKAPDLRGGAACLLAALVADGKSEIGCAEKLLRGYDSLKEKLSTLGCAVNIG